MICLKCLKEMRDRSHYGMHVECFCKWFGVDEIYEFSSLNRRSSSDEKDGYNPGSKDSSFFHGKFKKYSAQLDERTYILKMRQPEVPELPEVEYLSNQIGRELGVPVANFFIIDLQGELVFVTENFMQKKGADLQHICHYREDEQHNCKDLLNLIKEKTNSPHYINIFVKTILFDALIGNHDRHGRNIGFIVRPNKLELSPVYDNVSYLGLESGTMLEADFNLTGRISTSETDEPSMQHYVKQLQFLEYDEQVNEFYKAIDISSINRLID